MSQTWKFSGINETLDSVRTLTMASVEALEAQEIPPRAGDWLNRAGDWLNKELHPTIRKRTLALEAEYEDSGGCWAYTDWRRHQSWSRYFVDFVQPRHWMAKEDLLPPLPLLSLARHLTHLRTLQACRSRSMPIWAG